jgi:CelD/BcsL family acetyltransferase involved in cellulose biosynthesis
MTVTESLAGRPQVRDSIHYNPVSDLESLRGPWEALFREISPRFFIHRWDWHKAARDHLLDDVTYHAFFRGGTPIAIIPLVEAWSGPGSGPQVLELPRHTELVLKDALIHPDYQPPEKLTLLLERIRTSADSTADVVHFDALSDRTTLAATVAPDYPWARQTRLEGTVRCLCATSGDLDRLSAKHFRNVDRLQRKAERDRGPLEIRTHRGAGCADQGLEVFSRIEDASWKGPEGTGTSISSSRGGSGFYSSILARFGATGDARVDVLYIDGAPAASQMAVRCDRTWNLLKIAFDKAFTEVGPGNILLKAFIEEMAAEDQIDEVSLVTAPSWAARWHMTWQPTYHVAVFNRTVIGRLLLLRHDTRSRLKRILGRRTYSPDE